VLTEEIQGEPPVGRVDALRMEQVFRNLLENALASCPDPVEIVIACSQVEGSGPGRRLRVAVRDNGPGLPAEVAGRVLEPFFTTRSRGTGLGLAIVRRIVEAHGGTIQAGNREPGGAEFVVHLPADPCDPVAPAGPGTRHAGPAEDPVSRRRCGGRGPAGP
jgi:signal transduction histidine kinase